MKKKVMSKLKSQSAQLIIGTLTIIALVGIFGLIFLGTIREGRDQRVRVKITTDELDYRAPAKISPFNQDRVEDLIKIYSSEVAHRQVAAIIRIQNQFTLDSMRVRLEQQKAAELQVLEERVRATEKRVRAVEKWVRAAKDAAQHAEKEARQVTELEPQSQTEYSFTWINSRSEPCEVWIDGIIPRQVLKPGKSITVRVNTTIVAWARGTKTGHVWKCTVSREAIEASREKTLKIY